MFFVEKFLITFFSALNVIFHESISELDLLAGFESGQTEIRTRRATKSIAEIALEKSLIILIGI